ncbi:MAG: hypothetical protein GY900_08385, partial [Actinomycetia bacterium]|nr:hypothetical protein [Actinomycetes bacterium]
MALSKVKGNASVFLPTSVLGGDTNEYITVELLQKGTGHNANIGPYCHHGEMILTGGYYVCPWPENNLERCFFKVGQVFWKFRPLKQKSLTLTVKKCACSLRHGRGKSGKQTVRPTIGISLCINVDGDEWSNKPICGFLGTKANCFISTKETCPIYITGGEAV